MNSIIFAISLMLKIGVGGNILQSMCEQDGKYIEKHIGKDNDGNGIFKVSFEHLLSKQERELADIENDPFAIHQALTRPIQKSLEKILMKEAESVNELQGLMNRMQDFALKGRSGLGMEGGEVNDIIDSMSRRWWNIYKGEKAKGLKTLSEMINEINENGSFGDAMHLIQAVNKELNRAAILNNRYHPLNHDGVHALLSLEKSGSKVEHHKSPIEILTDYGLVDKNGIIKKSIQREILTNPTKAFDTHIKKAIYNKT